MQCILASVCVVRHVVMTGRLYWAQIQCSLLGYSHFVVTFTFINTHHTYCDDTFSAVRHFFQFSPNNVQWLMCRGSVFLDAETRRMMGEQAVSLAKSVEYTSAGKASTL